MNYITRIQNAINYIEVNLTGPVNIEQISRAACFSPFHFQRLFRVATGSAVKEYLRKRRLSAALTELKLSNKKVIEIAFDYQYESPEAFSRAFYTAYRMYPADYRNGSKVLNTFPRIELNSHKHQNNKPKKENKMSNEIKIVPYFHDYAEAVALMWQELSGTQEVLGHATGKTQEQVIDEENSSEYLELYLAIKNEKVIGYCKLLIDTDYDDVLYIHPLFVTDNTASQPLIEATLQKSIELGYGRLDLYQTIVGGEDSKQYGFMRKFNYKSPRHNNYLPLFAKTDLIKDLFNCFDPFKDSTRIITEKADIEYGSSENYFTYSWRKGNDELIIQIDGVRQFGIKKIETSEFSAELSITNPQIIYDQPNEVVFTIRNKTAKPLQAVLKNLKNNNLDFVLDKTAEIKDELIVKSSFTVTKNSGKSTDLSVNLMLNGKSALFSLGLKAKTILDISVIKEKTIFNEGEVSNFELVLQNNLDQEIAVAFKLPKEESLVFDMYEFQIKLAANEKLTLPLEFKLLAATVWQPVLKFKIKCADSGQFKQEQQFKLALPTMNGIYYGGGEVYIGRFQLQLSNNNFSDWLDDVSKFDTLSGAGNYVWFGSCKFIRVGTQELLLKTQPDSTDFEQETGSVKVSRTYSLKDSNHLKLIERFEISTNGMIKRWYEVKNNSTKPIKDAVTVYNHFSLYSYNWIIPYRNRFVVLNEEIQNEVYFWNSADFTENWLFAAKVGVCWPKENKFIFNVFHPSYGVEQTIDQIPAGATHNFLPVTASNGTFDNWHQFREFALQQKLEKADLTDSLNLQINNGNPFVESKISFKVEEIKNQSNDNTLKIKLNDQETSGLQKTADTNNCQEYQLNHLEKKPDLVVVDAILNNQLLEKSFKKVVIPKGCGIVKTGITTEQNCKIYTADNGLIQIKASPDFAPVVHSCVYNGVECFDSSFPKVKHKDMFVEWTGGSSFVVSLFTSQNLMYHEKFKVEFTEMTDNFGNQWSGIRIVIDCEKFLPLKGVTIERYFLLLPNSPVVYIFAVLKNNKNAKINHSLFGADTCLNPKLGNGDSYFVFRSDDGRLNKVKCGVNNYEIFTGNLMSYQFDDAPFKIDNYIVKQKTGGPYSAHGLCAFTYGNNNRPVTEKTQLLPNFLIFTNKDLETEWLKDLDNIRFEL